MEGLSVFFYLCLSEPLPMYLAQEGGKERQGLSVMHACVCVALHGNSRALWLSCLHTLLRPRQAFSVSVVTSSVRGHRHFLPPHPQRLSLHTALFFTFTPPHTGRQRHFPPLLACMHDFPSTFGTCTPGGGGGQSQVGKRHLQTGDGSGQGLPAGNLLCLAFAFLFCFVEDGLSSLQNTLCFLGGFLPSLACRESGDGNTFWHLPLHVRAHRQKGTHSCLCLCLPERKEKNFHLCLASLHCLGTRTLLPPLPQHTHTRLCLHSAFIYFPTSSKILENELVCIYFS